MASPRTAKKAEVDPNADIDALPLERCFQELEAIVERLEQEAIALEESLALFERGMRLSRRCSRELERVERRIRVITEGPDGQPTLHAINEEGLRPLGMLSPNSPPDDEGEDDSED